MEYIAPMSVVRCLWVARFCGGRERTRRTTNERRIMARRKGSGRTAGITQISISLPRSLVGQIDKLAKCDNRNRSNFIANTLQNLTRERLGVPEKENIAVK